MRTKIKIMTRVTCCLARWRRSRTVDDQWWHGWHFPTRCFPATWTRRTRRKCTAEKLLRRVEGLMIPYKTLCLTLVYLIRAFIFTTLAKIRWWFTSIAARHSSGVTCTRVTPTIRTLCCRSKITGTRLNLGFKSVVYFFCCRFLLSFKCFQKLTVVIFRCRYPEFTRYQGLDGIYLANKYNATNPLAPSRTDDVITQITFNKGKISV